MHNDTKKFGNIYLVGPMGSSKTSVGKQLANLTGNRFYDSDIEIEKRTGADISWIFEREGEKGFRKREVKMIYSLCKYKNIILSTGGGTVLIETNRRYLSENGIVVYLMVSVETQLKRIARKGKARPLFIKHNSKEKLQKLNKEREPLYQIIADFTYLTDGLKPRQLAIQILMDIQNLKSDLK
ncbi:MAG: shikimate kinase [Coxiella endosymbiont of Haemaphysalis qinghaiensis]